MIFRFKRPLLALIFALSVGVTPCTTHPLFSYLSSFRDLIASRISDASDEDVALLESQEDPMAQFEAARLRVTYADVAAPFISMAVSDTIKQYVSTPFSYIGYKTGFSTLYSWFSKKIKRAQVVPALIKGILSGAVIFAMTQVMSEKFYPNWVNKNYYAKTVVSRLCVRLAVVCGTLLVGSQLSDAETV